MMPDMRAPLRETARRFSCQVVRQRVVDGAAVQEGQRILRGSIAIAPMPAQKIAVKPEGQRTWKWWSGTSSVELKLGWKIKLDRDRAPGKEYEVMSLSDWSQARVFQYDFAETPR